MIEIRYDCTGDISHLTPQEHASLISELDHDNWFRDDWHITGNTLTIEGSCEVDDYSYAAGDVEYELKCLLWHYDIDADITARQIEYEPDWDKIPRGWHGRL